MTRDVGWDIVYQTGLQGVMQVSINDTWVEEFQSMLRG